MSDLSVADFNNKLAHCYNVLFNSGVLKHLKIFLVVYCILYCITFIISLCFLFKKENIKWQYALIPFYNVYIYLKIIDLNWIYAIIPVVNIFFLFYANYNFARTYKRNYLISFLTMVFPIFFIPYISINKDIAKYHKINSKPFLKNQEDVNNLEKKLDGTLKEENLYEINIPFNLKRNTEFKSSIEKKIDTIEENAIKEDYSEQLYQNETDFSNNTVKKEIVAETVIDDNLVDMFSSNETDIRHIGIEEKEKNIEANSNIKIIDNSDYKEYEKEGPNTSTIAFGGITTNKKIEDNVADSKVIDLKCPYCKSSLIKSNGTCPGCGRDVSEYVFSK